nr:Uma2 family endonuclease [Xenococcus sp. PCC 7305]
MPEIREYLLISQKRNHIMRYSKTEAGKWLLSEYETETSTIQFTSINFELKLSEIYHL